MNDVSKSSSAKAQELISKEIDTLLEMSIDEARACLKPMSPKERLSWAFAKFGNTFALTTSFGIQSSVLLHMLHSLQGGSEVPVVWVDTGYLPKETYSYAERLMKELSLNIKPVQSEFSPARMEALYGRLWETGNVNDLEKYHFIRKVQPLENSFQELNAHCWASGVRGGQTEHRKQMTCLDVIRGRLSLRPLLEWTPKDVFYYMQKNQLPQHPLFEKGYTTVGDWHSSSPEGDGAQGRETRFGGLKQECGIHLPGTLGEGI